MVSRIKSFRATFRSPKTGVPFLDTILGGRKAFLGALRAAVRPATASLGQALPSHQAPTPGRQARVTGRLHLTLLLPRKNAFALKARGTHTSAALEASTSLRASPGDKGSEAH